MTSTLLWWLVIQLMGLAALPLTWRLFARLPGRGYPFAKALGLLLVTFVLWLGAIFRLLPNDLGGCLVALAAVSLLSAWLGRPGLQRGELDDTRPLVRWLRANWRLVLITELLFLIVLIGWTAFRAYNPDIAGTEKPMEFAFINGILRSRYFPPQDPWLSGYAISYYYFGYVMLGVLIRLTGVDPAIGFNLGVALWYALAAIGVFGLVYDLVSLASDPHVAVDVDNLPRSRWRGIRYGLLGALLATFMGNLEGIVELAYNRRLLPLAWIEWLDIKNLTSAAPSGGWTGGFWWWWRASRVIHDKDLLGNSVEVIDEFPLFSFLLGDMHPHVLGLPFVLLTIALALNLLLGARGWRFESRISNGESRISNGEPSDLRIGERVSAFFAPLLDATGLGAIGIVLYAVVLGALAFLNTWDFPIYLTLVTLSFGVGLVLANGLTKLVVGQALGSGIALGVLGWLAYLPFYLGFQSQLGGVLPNLLFPTRLSQFFLMFGPFLVVIVGFLWLVSGSVTSRDLRRSLLQALPWSLLAPVALFALIFLGLAVLPSAQSYLDGLLDNPAVKANIGERTLGQLVGLVVRVRVATPWTYLLLAILIAWVVGLVWAALRTDDTGISIGDAMEEAERERSAQLVTVSPRHRVTPDLFALLLIGLALLLAYGVEFVYLRDLFGSRMNTVFKFYYQTWIMLAVASVYGLSRLAERNTRVSLKAPILALTGLLVLCGLFYPVAAIPSKADNFNGQPTLDGLAYLQRFNPADMAAIAWVRDNVPGDAVVVEASGGSYSPEGAGRVSMTTGNPTLLGWDFHERQWRGDAYDELAAGRPEALDEIYRTARSDELAAVLARWNVDYVYVGDLERKKFGIGDAGLARFDRVLTRVYDQDGVVVYAR